VYLKQEKNMKKLLILSGLLLSMSTAFATDGDQMVGVTANQWLRGGAIVASPTDVPSMIYNPAAIGMLGFDQYAFDLSLGVLNPPRSITSMTGKTESNSNYYLGMGNGFAVKISDNLFLGMAAGGVAGLGVDFPSGTLPDNPGTPPVDESNSIVTKKGLLKITPSLAYKPMDNLSIGVSFQIGQQSLALKTPGFILPQTEAWGYGGAIGAIYKISPKLQAGLSYVSQMSISEYEFNGTSPMAGEGVYKMTLDAPQSFAFGISFKPSPSLLIEGDVKWYNFSAVMDLVELETPVGSVIPLAFGWDDQIVYALGVDFMVNPGLCLKAGYNYGATPIGEEDVDSNLGSIAVVEHHISLGVTKVWNKNVSTTLSYTRGLYNEVKSSSPSGIIIAAEQNIIFVQLGFNL